MKSYLRRQEGQGLVEYALLLVLVAIVIIAILALLGDQINGVFARVVAAINGQEISGTGTEYVITGMNASVTGTAPFCTVTVSGMRVTVFEDGQVAGAGVSVSGIVAYSGGSSQGTSGTTDASGTANLSNVSGGGNCSGTATLTISGGGSRTISYSN